ncbi:hypothetical protein GCM10011348_15800 [Marinobacterium nitratireducens]|uniref:Uncharacterized protein n=1 Tax=Marinobacterium nitratireducens TaxID=518897 RepID=A0A917ZB93_9GAMM|nr:hypothetical protein GCM10011348_15800 [Marinobacterium nitratireducens]
MASFKVDLASLDDDADSSPTPAERLADPKPKDAEAEASTFQLKLFDASLTTSEESFVAVDDSDSVSTEVANSV